MPRGPPKTRHFDDIDDPPQITDWLMETTALSASMDRTKHYTSHLQDGKDIEEDVGVGAIANENFQQSCLKQNFAVKTGPEGVGNATVYGHDEYGCDIVDSTWCKSPGSHECVPGPHPCVLRQPQADEVIGPGATDYGHYKNKLYFLYTPTSFTDLIVQMQSYRQTAVFARPEPGVPNWGTALYDSCGSSTPRHPCDEPISLHKTGARPEFRPDSVETSDLSRDMIENLVQVKEEKQQANFEEAEILFDPYSPDSTCPTSDSLISSNICDAETSEEYQPHRKYLTRDNLRRMATSGNQLKFSCEPLFDPCCPSPAGPPTDPASPFQRIKKHGDWFPEF